MKNACLTIEAIELKLRAAGVNATAQRIAICHYILCEADHPSVDDIKAWADKNFAKMSLATVYNTMHILEDAGLVRSFQFPHNNKIIYDHNVHDHYHVYDEGRGCVVDVPSEAISFSEEFQKEYRVKSASVVIYGSKR